MADDNDLHRRLDDAFASRSVGGSSLSPPDVDELLARSQQKHRRSLVAGTLGVLALGVVGIAAFAGSGASTPDARSDALPPVDQATSTTISLGQPAWSCVGPLGTSDDGTVAFYESCTPADGSWSPYAPTTTVLAPDTTFACTTDTFSPVEATTTIAYCGSPVGEPASTESAATTTVTIPCTIPGCQFQDGEETTSPYTVQMGDYALLVAERFCTTVDALIAANQWSGPDEFPFPGVVMLIPAAGCSVVPPPTSTIPG